MALTLGNNLTGLVSREVDAAGRKASGLGDSMTTGINKFVPVVDAFLGNSLRDNEIILGAVSKNTSYSVNMLTIANEYMSSIATALQGGLTAVSSAGQVSSDKIPTLQKSLNDKVEQVNLLIKTADFDNKALFAGDVLGLGVQVGLNTQDTLPINIQDISNSKIFRTSVSSAINEWLTKDATRSALYTGDANAAAFDNAVKYNNNLLYAGVTDTSANSMTDAQFATALSTVITANPALGVFLDSALPLSKAALTAANAGVTFANADVAQLTALVARPTVVATDARLALVGAAVVDQAGIQATADLARDNIIAAFAGDANLAAIRAAVNTAAANGAVAHASHDAARNAVRIAAINADAALQLTQATHTMNAATLNAAAAFTIADAQAVTPANAAIAIQALVDGPNPLKIPQAAADAALAASVVVAPPATVLDVRTAALNFGNGNRNELVNILGDGAPTKIDTVEGRAIANDVIINALSHVRKEQSNIANQKSNIVESTDALRATTNVTQQAADSYLKADYVLTAQEYSETLRTMIAAITALQAANKIPEAAQRLLDALTR